MRLLITGGCGFLGSNLAARAIARGDELHVLDNLSRTGARDNLEWLEGQGKFTFTRDDVRDPKVVERAVRGSGAEAVFHLAGQVAMTTSIEDPRADFEINALGSLNVLEAVRRHAPGTAVIYSSSNKVYGDLERFTYREEPTRYVCVERPDGFDEGTPLDFHSPYGCSKGAADQYMLDYARVFGLNTVVFRHSTMYGGRQFATYDQGWIGWFCRQAVLAQQGALAEPFTVSGSGKQVRDVLHADDVVDLYFATLEHLPRARGEAFNIGGGVAHSLSLLELFALLEARLGVPLRYRHLPPRESDQKVFVADIAKAVERIGWRPRVGATEGVARALDWTRDRT